MSLYLPDMMGNNVILLFPMRSSYGNLPSGHWSTQLNGKSVTFFCNDCDRQGFNSVAEQYGCTCQVPTDGDEIAVDNAAPRPSSALQHITCTARFSSLPYRESCRVQLPVHHSAIVRTNHPSDMPHRVNFCSTLMTAPAGVAGRNYPNSRNCAESQV